MSFRSIPSISATVNAEAEIQSELKLNLVRMVKSTKYRLRQLINCTGMFNSYYQNLIFAMYNMTILIKQLVNYQSCSRLVSLSSD